MGVVVLFSNTSFGEFFFYAFQVDIIRFVEAPVPLSLNSMEWLTVRISLKRMPTNDLTKMLFQVQQIFGDRDY